MEKHRVRVFLLLNSKIKKKQIMTGLSYGNPVIRLIVLLKWSSQIAFHSKKRISYEGVLTVNN